MSEYTQEQVLDLLKVLDGQLLRSGRLGDNEGLYLNEAEPEYGIPWSVRIRGGGSTGEQVPGWMGNGGNAESLEFLYGMLLGASAALNFIRQNEIRGESRD